MPTSSDEAAFRRKAHLSVENLSAGYGGAPIIHDVSITVGLGEIVAVVGPNGSGKSTLIKAILGIVRALDGKVRLDNADITGLRTDQLARMGIAYVPQNHDVFETLTVHENLRIGAYQMPRQEVEARVEEVLGFFPSLKPLMRRHAHKLSGGERKLLACARTMMLRPAIFVMDEPTSSLSVDLAAHLLDEHVTRIAKAGSGVLLVEQKAKAALEVADWAYLMVGGRIGRSTGAAALLADESIAEMFLGKIVGEPQVQLRRAGGTT